MLKMYDALPAYFGGKRKLAKKILSYAEGKIFIDAFMGGGSVSLLAKAKGYQVIANDIANRCAIIGQALITNCDVTIEDEDLVRLFITNENNRHYIRDHHSNQFTLELTEFLDNARTNIEEFSDPIKKSLMMLLWMKVILHFRPMAAFGHVGAVQQLIEQEADTDTIKALREKYSRPLYATLRDIADDINSGVFDNGNENSFSQLDALKFLESIQGDTVYLDPPYFGTESYERHYGVLDNMIAQAELEHNKSIFNTKHVMSCTAKMFESCEHIPVWIFSIGQRVIDKRKYIDLMSEYRNVEDHPVNISHSYAYGSNEESGSQEVLLVGRPK